MCLSAWHGSQTAVAYLDGTGGEPMHEASIAAGLMGILQREAARRDAVRIVRVRLRIGRLAAVEKRQLVECFALFAEGTLADGAEVAIEEVPVTARCTACGEVFTVEGWRFTCPACASGEVVLLTGRELSLESFDAEAPEPSTPV